MVGRTNLSNLPSDRLLSNVSFDSDKNFQPFFLVEYENLLYVRFDNFTFNK